MDPLQASQKLINTTIRMAQEGAQNVSQSVDAVQQNLAEIATDGGIAFEQLQASTWEWMQQSSETLEQTVEFAKNNVSGMVAAGSATIEDLKQQSSQAIQHGVEVWDGMLNSTQTIAVELSTSGFVLSAALKDLPKTAEELAREMPKIANRLRNRAGLRVGDAPRSDADVMKLFEKIPGTSKLGASETRIREFLADKHGSHIISRQQGGSNGADNILWEIGTDNLRRGAKVMTGREQVYIRFYNAVDSILKNSGTIARLGITATGTAIVTQAVVTAASYALDLYRGDITADEFCKLVKDAAVSTGIATPVFFLIFTAVLALFPELTVLLAAPAVVAGFNLLFGVGVAVPIIQSLLRHLQAVETANADLGDAERLMGAAE